MLDISNKSFWLHKACFTCKSLIIAKQINTTTVFDVFINSSIVKKISLSLVFGICPYLKQPRPELGKYLFNPIWYTYTHTVYFVVSWSIYQERKTHPLIVPAHRLAAKILFSIPSSIFQNLAPQINNNNEGLISYQ